MCSKRASAAKQNVILQLDDLHHALLKDPKFAEYGAEFYKTLPFIVELRAKQGDEKLDEIETALPPFTAH